MCEWVPGEQSPDRMDALVWAVTELTTRTGGRPLIGSGTTRTW
jgi:phage terminase large subunit-like protein